MQHSSGPDDGVPICVSQDVIDEQLNQHVTAVFPDATCRSTSADITSDSVGDVPICVCPDENLYEDQHDTSVIPESTCESTAGQFTSVLYTDVPLHASPDVLCEGLNGDMCTADVSQLPEFASNMTETAMPIGSSKHSCLIECLDITHNGATSKPIQSETLFETEIEQLHVDNSHNSATYLFDRDIVDTCRLDGANAIPDTDSQCTDKMSTLAFNTEATCDTNLSDSVSLETVENIPSQLLQSSDKVTDNDTQLAGGAAACLSDTVLPVVPTDIPVQPKNSQHSCQEHTGHIPDVDSHNCDITDDLHDTTNTLCNEPTLLSEHDNLLIGNVGSDCLHTTDVAVAVGDSDPFEGDDHGLAALFAEECILSTMSRSRHEGMRGKERSRAAKARKKQQQKLSRQLQASKGQHRKGSRHKFAQNFHELEVRRDCDIIHDVDPSLTCAVCLEMYHQPSICQPCGHIFCDLCLRRLTGQGSESVPCPLCRAVIMSCEMDREFDEQLMVNHPDIYTSRSLTYKDSKFRRHNLPYTPPLPMSERLLRHLAASRVNQSAARWRSHDWYKFLLGCAAGVCVCVAIMLLLRVRTERTAADVKVMFLSLVLGAGITAALYRLCRF